MKLQASCTSVENRLCFKFDVESLERSVSSFVFVENLLILALMRSIIHQVCLQ